MQYNCATIINSQHPALCITPVVKRLTREFDQYKACAAKPQHSKHVDACTHSLVPLLCLYSQCQGPVRCAPANQRACYLLMLQPMRPWWSDTGAVRVLAAPLGVVVVQGVATCGWAIIGNTCQGQHALHDLDVAVRQLD